MKTDSSALRFRLILFLFMLSGILLLTARKFHHSDGFIEYQVGRRLVTAGAIDLPAYKGRNSSRVPPGPDGRHYAVFGIGQPLLFAATVFLDGHAREPLARRWGVPVDPARPFFFSVAANAPVHALTGLVLFALMRFLSVATPAAAAAALLYTFGSMALWYSRLSYDMPLALLFLSAALCCLFAGGRSGRPGRWFGAGAFFGLALLTRLTTLLYLPAGAIYFLLLRRRPEGKSAPRPGWRAAAAALLPVAAALIFVGWYNTYRFGSPFATGYSRGTSAFHFDAPFLHSLAALLFSPGRSLFLFSPLLVLALAGLPRLLRAFPREGLTLAAVIAVNLLFFSFNRNWHTAHAWGARFQLPVVLLLTVPLGFRLDGILISRSKRKRVAVGTACVLVVLLQVGALAVHYAPAEKRFWDPASSQLRRSTAALARTVARGEAGRLDSWWVTPKGGTPPMRLFAGGLLVLFLSSGLLLLRNVRDPATGRAGGTLDNPRAP